MDMTPLDIRNQEFRKKTLGGLDSEEVQAFLGQVAAEYELRLREAQESQDKLKHAQDKLSHFQSIESSLQETALTLQKILEEKKAAAQKEAEFIIAEAKNNAYKETEAIRRESEQLRSEIVGLRSQKAAFFSRIRNALRTQEELLQAMERDEMENESFSVASQQGQPQQTHHDKPISQGRMKRQAARDIRAPGAGAPQQSPTSPTQAQATPSQSAPVQATPSQAIPHQAAPIPAQAPRAVKPTGMQIETDRS